MGMDEILKDIIAGGEVLQKVLCDKHKPHGPFSNQLEKLRKRGLVDRYLVLCEDVPGRRRKQWMCFPTKRALRLAGKETQAP
ncbi:MAG: hypothetical protein PHH85_14285 [Candidatus Methanoperedens sp.]|nr:hypothetical protein [Candidatus Methanoperedens sp.]